MTNRLTQAARAAIATQAEHPDLLAEIVRHAGIRRARSMLAPVAPHDFQAVLINARFAAGPRKLDS